jgi:hypothetical protein
MVVPCALCPLPCDAVNDSVRPGGELVGSRPCSQLHTCMFRLYAA